VTRHAGQLLKVKMSEVKVTRSRISRQKRYNSNNFNYTGRPQVWHAEICLFKIHFSVIGERLLLVRELDGSNGGGVCDLTTAVEA